MACDFNVSKMRQALLISHTLLKDAERKLGEWPELQAEIHVQVEKNKGVLYPPKEEGGACAI